MSDAPSDRDLTNQLRKARGLPPLAEPEPTLGTLEGIEGIDDPEGVDLSALGDAGTTHNPSAIWTTGSIWIGGDGNDGTSPSSTTITVAGSSGDTASLGYFNSCGSGGTLEPADGTLRLTNSHTFQIHKDGQWFDLCAADGAPLALDGVTTKP